MVEKHRWSHVEIAGVEFDVPAGMLSHSDHGIDGPVAELEGEGLRLLLDASLFADPLTGHRAKPGFSIRTEQIAGEQREIVEFLSDTGTRAHRLLAVRLPGLTATVQFEDGEEEEATALRILRSLRTPATPETDA